MIGLFLLLSQVGLDDSEILRAVAAKASSVKEKSIGELTGFVGLQFLNTPYVGGTLDLADATEECVVNLKHFDCVTFYEASLAIARLVKDGKASDLSHLKQEIMNLRYRQGKIDGYVSRLHYSAEWFDECVNKKAASWVQGSGETLKPDVYFMSKNSQLYRKLKSNPSLVPRIQKMERAISAKSYPWISKRSLELQQKKLKTGDIVAITTSVPGLDCSHTGMIVVKKGVPRLLHASSSLKKVVLGPSIFEYVSNQKSATGIFAIRPSEVTR